MSFFFWLIFALPLIFSILSVMCLGVGFFIFILPGIYLVLCDRFQFSVEIHLFEDDLENECPQKNATITVELKSYPFSQELQLLESFLPTLCTPVLSHSDLYVCPAWIVAFVMAKLRTLWNVFSADVVT